MGKPKIDLTAFEDMLKFEPETETNTPLSSLTQGGISEMNFEQMEAFPDHKFKLYEGQRLYDMAESIRQFGILLPMIIWHTEDNRNIILSGHNRRNAGKIAGLKKAPVIIKENLTMEDAVLIVTETNLHQRSLADMSHSERAYCLSQHYEAIKSQGKRNDLLEEIEKLLKPDEIEDSDTCAEVQQRLKSRDRIGQEYGLSRDKVAKYIRIAKLIPSLLQRLDREEISFLAAYDLSFIEDKNEQQKIEDFIESDEFKIDMKKAEMLRQYYEQHKLTDSVMVQILSGEKTRKPKSNKPQPVKVKPAVISKYFKSGESRQEIESIIDQALALYFQSLESHSEEEMEP